MLKVNEYFEGNVKSVSFASDRGEASVGVMAAGEYEFGTNLPEKMTIISGALSATLPGESETKVFTAGMSFDVPGSSKFTVKVSADCAYLCDYIAE